MKLKKTYSLALTHTELHMLLGILESATEYENYTPDAVSFALTLRQDLEAQEKAYKARKSYYV